MYKMREEAINEVKCKYKARNIANTVGITESYLSLILSNNRTCSKKVAYAITKYLDEEAEISDFFENVK